MVGEGIGLSPKGQIPLLAQVRGDGGAKGAITHSISNVPKGAQILPQTLSTFPGWYVLRHQHIYVPCVCTSKHPAQASTRQPPCPFLRQHTPMCHLPLDCLFLLPIPAPPLQPPTHVCSSVLCTLTTDLSQGI